MQAKDRLAWLLVAVALWFYQGGGGLVPTPPAPVVPVSGERDVVIVRDPGKDTPAYARLWVALRTGPAEKFFADGKHCLTLIDPDADWEDDLEKSLRPEFADAQLPLLIVVDMASRQVLAKQPITDATTADNIVEYVRRTGG